MSWLSTGGFERTIWGLSGWATHYLHCVWDTMQLAEEAVGLLLLRHHSTYDDIRG
jgi:hypothetical protein